MQTTNRNNRMSALARMLMFVGTVALTTAGMVYAQSGTAQAPSVHYDVSFPNAVHHEAEFVVTYRGLPAMERFEVRMSRSSPGRYAIHEFAKNVHSVQISDAAGRELAIHRPDPYSWVVEDVEGTVEVRYTLFADRAGGTYSGIDLSHAHLNMPATFMWARDTEDYPITVRFTPATPEWRVATQLFPTDDPYTFTSPNLYYFLDSPTELSDHDLRTWTVENSGTTYTIRLALHHLGTDAEAAAYAEMARKVVDEQIAVFGEPPAYDGGTYTFIADYLPWVSGDGMEHRNSTVIASTRPLSTGALRNLGTLSHEYFHQWNVERIRPAMLEPFDFTRANMSRELWFAEGFTSYYTSLMIRRAGLISDEEYASGLSGTVNTVLNAPGRSYFSAVEMSMQAPFVDAATSIDPTNRGNRFISYYTWGSGLGLALDLMLRARFELTLDGYMRMMWTDFGKQETPYVVDDLRATLAKYTGDASFADRFFDRFVEGHEAPDYTELLGTVGLQLRRRNAEAVWVGAPLRAQSDSTLQVVGYPTEGSLLHAAGISSGAVLTSVNGSAPADDAFDNIRAGMRVEIVFSQRGVAGSATVFAPGDPGVEVVTFEAAGIDVPPDTAARRQRWLQSGVSSDR